jgi:hypothetical protein
MHDGSVVKRATRRPESEGELEAVAKKYNFANYDAFDDVADNVGLIMSGIDPDTKKNM